MTNDELRKEIGLNPSRVEGNMLGDALQLLSPLIANKVLESLTFEEKRSIVGLETDKGLERTLIETTTEFSKNK